MGTEKPGPAAGSARDMSRGGMDDPMVCVGENFYFLFLRRGMSSDDDGGGGEEEEEDPGIRLVSSHVQ